MRLRWRTAILRVLHLITPPRSSHTLHLLARASGTSLSSLTTRNARSLHTIGDALWLRLQQAAARLGCHLPARCTIQRLYLHPEHARALAAPCAASQHLGEPFVRRHAECSGRYTSSSAHEGLAGCAEASTASLLPGDLAGGGAAVCTCESFVEQSSPGGGLLPTALAAQQAQRDERRRWRVAQHAARRTHNQLRALPSRALALVAQRSDVAKQMLLGSHPRCSSAGSPTCSPRVPPLPLDPLLAPANSLCTLPSCRLAFEPSLNSSSCPTDAHSSWSIGGIAGQSPRTHGTDGDTVRGVHAAASLHGLVPSPFSTADYSPCPSNRATQRAAEGSGGALQSARTPSTPLDMLSMRENEMPSGDGLGFLMPDVLPLAGGRACNETGRVEGQAPVSERAPSAMLRMHVSPHSYSLVDVSSLDMSSVATCMAPPRRPQPAAVFEIDWRASDWCARERVGGPPCDEGGESAADTCCTSSLHAVSVALHSIDRANSAAGDVNPRLCSGSLLSRLRTTGSWGDMCMWTG